MNAVEKLEAAIAKLEGLRGESSTGPWLAWRRSPMYFGIEDAFAEDVVTGTRSPDVELIEVLHRTIGAQLEILREAYGMTTAYADSDEKTRETYRFEVHLAESILGVSDADVG